MTYTVRAFDIVDGERKLRGEARMDERIAAEEIFNLLGPYYDVVQLWSEDENGNPVYRQF
jgi:hypothetical protein